MPIEKMCMVTLTGPLGMLDTAIHNFVVNREFHLENAAQTMGGSLRLTPVADSSNPYASAIAAARRCAAQLVIPLGFAEFSAPEPDKAKARIETLCAEVDSLLTERDRLNRRAQDCDALRMPISHMLSVDEKLINLLNMKYVKFRYGRMRSAEYELCLEELRSREGVFSVETGPGGDWAYIMYFVLPSIEDVVDTLLTSKGFERIPIDLSLRGGGTAAEVSEGLLVSAGESRKKAREIDERLNEMALALRGSFLRDYSCLRFYSDSFVLRSMAAKRAGRFFLIGWIPRSERDAYVQECERGGVFSCFAANAGEIDFAGPPTKLKNGPMAKVFEPFLGMYGLPHYTELDPSLFMALTYMLFFGIMFGDVGQGICLALAGLFVSLRLKNWLGGIMTCCGLAGTIFGFLYGSVFGNEKLLPGFKILKDHNVTVLLVASLIIGVAMIGCVMLLSIVGSARQKRWQNVFFGANGLAGFFFYFGLISAAGARLALGVNLFHLWYTLPALVLPLLLIMLKEPLWLLIRRDPELKRIKLGGAVAVGFFELFETVLSYLTNTLSFLRIGAYAITHVGLMLVIGMLAGENKNLLVHIIGNIFVIGFEGLLVGIQVLRLEFYELFGRFYMSGGKPFKPKMIDYSE